VTVDGALEEKVAMMSKDDPNATGTIGVRADCG
jgi:hypothetical protein